jgi:hypothetical protein
MTATIRLRGSLTLLTRMAGVEDTITSETVGFRNHSPVTEELLHAP